MYSDLPLLQELIFKRNRAVERKFGHIALPSLSHQSMHIPNQIKRTGSGPNVASWTDERLNARLKGLTQITNGRRSETQVSRLHLIELTSHYYRRWSNYQQQAAAGTREYVDRYLLVSGSKIGSGYKAHSATAADSGIMGRRSLTGHLSQQQYEELLESIREYLNLPVVPSAAEVTIHYVLKLSDGFVMYGADRTKP
jgi:hypothetical protein